MWKADSLRWTFRDQWKTFLSELDKHFCTFHWQMWIRQWAIDFISPIFHYLCFTYTNSMSSEMFVHRGIHSYHTFWLHFFTTMKQNLVSLFLSDPIVVSGIDLLLVMFCGEKVLEGWSLMLPAGSRVINFSPCLICFAN